MIRIAAIGAVVEDRLRLPGGTEFQQLGGLGYTVGALAALGGPEVTVVPVCRADRELEARLRQTWGALQNVAFHGIVASPGPMPRVEITYGDAAVGGDRRERLLHPPAPLRAAEVRPALDCDAVIVNCITGFDLELEAGTLLATGAGHLHLDAHSLLLGRDAEGYRYPARPADFERWAVLPHTLQMNGMEADVARAGEPLRQWVQSLRSERLTGLVVTRGGDGAELHVRSGGPVTVTAPPVERPDPTGAGDVLGAAFTLGLARGLEPLEALRAAVLAATASCTGTGPDSLHDLARRTARLDSRNFGRPTT